jgi:hypothetical protein
MAPNQRHFPLEIVLRQRLGSQPRLGVRIVGAAVLRRQDYLGTIAGPRMEMGNVFAGEAKATGRNPGTGLRSDAGRHSGMRRKAQTRNLEIPGSMLRIAPE